VPEKDARKCSVLIADDSEEDSFFLERALRHSTRFELVGSVRNGAEVIAYFSAAKRPGSAGVAERAKVP
jgi:hypothetical protein